MQYALGETTSLIDQKIEDPEKDRWEIMKRTISAGLMMPSQEGMLDAPAHRKIIVDAEDIDISNHKTLDEFIAKCNQSASSSSVSSPVEDAVKSTSDQDIIKSYLVDESRIKTGSAERVYFPETEQQIVLILSEANKKGIPVTVRGAGTGLVAGAVPFGGWVMSTEKMNKIIDAAIEIPGERGHLIVQPGVRLEEVQNKAEELGLFYPPNPTETNATIGGNVNTDASGSRAFKYGSTRGYVDRIRLVLANGEILDLERGVYRIGYEELPYEVVLQSGSKMCIDLPKYDIPFVKSSAGYYIGLDQDLIDLFIGSEGTMGVVTEIELLLAKPPKSVITYLIFYDTLKEALNFVENARDISRNTWQTLGSNGLDIRAIDFIDRSALKLLGANYGRLKIPEESRCALLVEQELNAEVGVDNFTNFPAVSELLGLIGEDRFYKEGQVVVALPADRQCLQLLRDFRHDIPAKVNELLKFEKMGTDLIVPDEYLAKFIRYYEPVLKNANLPYAIWGHIGLNQFHINFMPQIQAEYERAKQAYKKLAQLVVELGGSIAAEHGIGKTKHPYLKMMFGEGGIKEMQRFKAQVDPLCILGRGNIFPYLLGR